MVDLNTIVRAVCSQFGYLAEETCKVVLKVPIIKDLQTEIPLSGAMSAALPEAVRGDLAGYTLVINYPDKSSCQKVEKRLCCALHEPEYFSFRFEKIKTEKISSGVIQTCTTEKGLRHHVGWNDSVGIDFYSSKGCTVTEVHDGTSVEIKLPYKNESAPVDEKFEKALINFVGNISVCSIISEPDTRLVTDRLVNGQLLLFKF